MSYTRMVIAPKLTAGRVSATIWRSSLFWPDVVATDRGEPGASRRSEPTLVIVDGCPVVTLVWPLVTVVDGREGRAAIEEAPARRMKAQRLGA
ncbi:hypothetical protein I6A62_35690 [Frankia sp. AgW1.1]|nr:hypothetical protein [Frankia sp. AgW1.1]